MTSSLPEKWQWFPDARYGLFIHWGPYAAYERGEQVLFREHLDPRDYEIAACAWNPQQFDAEKWARIAVEGGFKYAVLTTRHHDGYCLWKTQTTDYSSSAQAPRRDFVAEYVTAFRNAGLRVGLYYSLADWRIPAYWEGPRHDPQGWDEFRSYVHSQVRELLSNYGQIDEFWFDGSWPRNAAAWQSEELVAMMRTLQPDILINNRLDAVDPEEGEAVWQKSDIEGAGGSKTFGDFGTPEHHITAENRLWESCQTSVSRLWGYTRGEHWRSAEQLLDFLCESASKGGNLLLNVGPDNDGAFPSEFVDRSKLIGDWLRVHGEAIYGSEKGDVVESVTRGYQTVKGSVLYLILRFYDGREELRLAGLENRVLNAKLLSNGQDLAFSQDDISVTLRGFPAEKPTPLYPVVRLELDGPPRALPAFRKRLWVGDPRRMTEWARSRGDSVNAYKENG
jgi:alpha-L-fucosidase